MSTTKNTMRPTNDVTRATAAPAAAPAGEEQIRVNGYAQVLEMLQIADADFRESLLKRLAQRDPALARSLRTHLRGNA